MKTKVSRPLSLLALATLLVCLSLSAFLEQARAEVTPPKGFIALFNGEDLTGWHGMDTYDIRKLKALSPEDQAKEHAKSIQNIEQHWRAENGELINDGQGLYLTTDKEYGDIELRLEYKTVALADSGIYLRGTPQIQIWDSTKEGGKWNIGADKGSGGLWNNPAGSPGKDPLVLADKPFGEWNSFRIIQVGELTTVFLNGKKVVDKARMANYFDKGAPLWAQGPIQLQTHGGEIRWRNVFLREIPPKEANAMLRRLDNEGFKSIFNGENFKGWAGPTDNYEIKDGAVACKDGKGGTIYTEKEYSDFIVKLEFLLPPGGNNGLAIRYPGSGDTAYVGMCELQVLDDTAAGYKKLDPRQYHGSAYGMAAAHRGFLRDVGEWNFQQVTVKGSTIQVELNGTLILDTDLGKISDYMANSPHPGKDRKTGHFGFAGHSSPVQFRNVTIKEL